MIKFKVHISFVMLFLFISCGNDELSNSQKRSNNWLVFFTFLNIQANQENGNCPTASGVNSLAGGTYNINLQNGEIYWFDPIVRYQYYINQYWFEISENAGQDIKFYKVGCKNKKPEIDKFADSGNPGATERSLIWLYDEERLYLYYLQMDQGAGSFDFIVPSSAN